MRKCFVTQYCVLSSQITSVGYVGNVIGLKFVQESFKVLFEKEVVKNMMFDPFSFILMFPFGPFHSFSFNL